MIADRFLIIVGSAAAFFVTAASCASDPRDSFNDAHESPEASTKEEGGGGFARDSGPTPRPPQPACQRASAERSSVGCDFYAIHPYRVPPGSERDPTGCYVVFVTNPSSEPVTIEVEYAGQSLDVSKFARMPRGSGGALRYVPLPGGKLPANEVAILSLHGHYDTSQDSGGCPAHPATEQITDLSMLGVDIDKSGYVQAFHLMTDAPTVAYDLFPYGRAGNSTAGASLLLPTSIWDTNYIAVAPYSPWPTVNSEAPELAVIGLTDDTTFSIRPTVAIVGGTGVAGTPKGVAATYKLSKGQALIFQQKEALTGSPIESNKPVGVIGMSGEINIGPCCADTMHQPIPPLRALGHEYAAVRYGDRVAGKPESIPWRVVGAVNGTVLTYEPAAPPDAPTTLALGQTATFKAEAAFVVRSQDADHPFYLSGHMEGGEDANMLGDPESVTAIPPDQYLPSYVLFTDPTYPNTSLVVVRKKNAAGSFEDVTLDCTGVLKEWQDIGTSAYQFRRVDLVKDEINQGACSSGRHEIHSSTPFTVTVWGWANYSSYAYPAGASGKAVNSVVVR